MRTYRFLRMAIAIACMISMLVDSACADNIGFNGEAQDGNTVFLRARYYDPVTGTFISKDPLGVTGGSPNQYTYAGNNPANYSDHNGQFVWILVGAGVGGLIAGGVEWYRGGDITQITKAAGIGALSGAALASGAALLGAAYEAGSIGAGTYVTSIGVAGAVNSGGANLATQVAVNPNLPVNWQSVGSSTLVGGGLGILGGAVSVGAGAVISNGETAAANLTNAQNQLQSLQTTLNDLSEGAGGGTVISNPLLYSAQANVVVSASTAQTASYIATGAEVGEHAINDVLSPLAEPYLDSVVDKLGESESTTQVTIPTGATDLPSLDNLATSSLNVGGVLINEAATLVGTNLSSIQGATYDPTTKQIVFLGSNNTTNSTLSSINMDYYYTAIQAVYGSATPPYVTLDPPASPATQWPFSQTFTNNSTQGFVMLYNPLWAGEDTTVAVRFRLTNQSGTLYDFTYNFNCVELNGTNGYPSIYTGRYAMGLVYSNTTGTPPSGLTLNTGPFQSGVPESMVLNSSQTSYWPVQLTNLTGGNLVVSSVTVIPARQHREYGGRIDATKLGWVMYEADRVMKCLAVGKDNLTGASYSSTSGNVNVSGYKNLEEIAQSIGDTGGFNRMWFEPDDMTLQRYVDPTSGQATIGFQSSTVQLLTEAYLNGVPADPAASQFASFFTQNYSAFATQNFPVEDPVNPSTVDNVPIFAMLQQAMQAVCLARFFHDNNIPLDNWWMSSYTPPTANSPLSIPTAYNEAPTGSPWYLIYGGVRIHKPNDYVPSNTAQNLGSSVLSTRPAATSSSATDVPGQSWTVSGTTTAVSASLAQASQDGNINLNHTDLSFASPGELSLKASRYYQSSWTGSGRTVNMGPGWRATRYMLQFSAPTWNDQYHLFTDGNGHQIATAGNGDTHLRSGTVRMVDLASGAFLDFTSSLNVTYGLNAQGNPMDTVTGLNTNDFPTFTPATHQSGATLAQNNDGTFDYTLTMPNGSAILFDPSGNVLQTTDRHGHKQIYAYNSSGQLSTVTDDANQVLTYSYNSTSGLLAGISGPSSGSNEESVSYRYNGNGDLIGVVNGLTNVAIFQYTYNTQNQLATITKMDGTTPLTTTADMKGRSSTSVDNNGNTSNFVYQKNGDGSYTTTVTATNSGLPSPATKNSDSSGRTTSITNMLSHTTSYGYTGNSMLPNSIQLPTPGRPPLQITRNNLGQPTSFTDPSVTGAQLEQVSYTPSTNLPSQLNDAAGRTTKFFYTSSHNNIQTIQQTHNGTNVNISFGYDGNDNLTTLSNALGYSWTLGRDALGRVTSLTDPTGVQVSCTYDQFGNISTVTDPRLSSKIKYGYDNLHRLTSMASPTGTVTYIYDPVTQWVDSAKQTDTSGNTLASVSYNYNNSTGQVTGVTTQLTPPGSTTSTPVTTTYAYNSYGGVQSVTPSGSMPINYSYNAAGQLLGTSETDSGPAVGPTIIASNATTGVWTNQNSQTMSWGAPESSLPITGFSYAEDGSAGTTVNASGTNLAWNNVSDGQHIFAMRAVDSAGNWSPQSVFNLWIDTTPPVITTMITSPSPVPAGPSVVSISANVSDALSGLGTNVPQLEWCISSNSSRNWSAPIPMTAGSGSLWTASFSQNGSQQSGQILYWQVIAQDVAGNSSTVGNSAPMTAGGLGVAAPLWSEFAVGLLLIILIARFFPKKRASPTDG